MGVVEKFESDQRTIEGNLERIDLASVLQVLQSNGSEGILELQDGEDVVELFYCNSFGVTLARSGVALGEALLSRLLHQSVVTHEQYDHALSECGNSASNAVDVIHEMDIVDEIKLVDCLRECIEEEVYQLFFLKDATFRFHPEAFEPLDHWGIATLDPLGIPLDRVVLEAARRIDEWAILCKKIPNLEIIFDVCAERVEEMGAPSPWMQKLVLELVDGQRNLEEVAGLSSLSEYEVCRTVDQLAESGWIVPLQLGDLIRHGERQLKRNQVDLAIKYLSTALECGGADARIFELMARALEKLDDHTAAAENRVAASEILLAQGDVVEAYGHLEHAAELQPGDVTIAVRRLEVYVEHCKDHALPTAKDLVNEAIGVSRKLIESGDTNRAVELLRKLDVIEKGNLSIKSEMIEILLSRGLVAEAIAEYERLGSFLVARGEYEDARRIYRKILSLDHRRFDIAEKLKKIERMSTHRKGRNRRIALLVLFLMLVGAAAGGYAYYSMQAQRIVDESLDLAKADPGGRQHSLQRLRGVTEKFRFAPAARSADDEVRRLQVESRHARVDAELQRKDREEAAQARLDVALDRISAGKLEAALVELQKAIDLAPGQAWVAEHDLEAQKVRLLDYLTEAEDLYARSREAIERLDYSAGFELGHTLRDEYPKSPFARMVRIPLEIDTIPSGAKVELAGIDTPFETPCTLLVDPNMESYVSISLAGHESIASRRLDLSRPSYTVPLYRTPRQAFEAEGPIVGRPAAAEGLLYVASRDASIAAVDPTSGTVAWKRRLGPLADVESDVLAIGDRLYFGSNDRQLYALSRDRGTVVWKAPATGFVKVAPWVGESTTYFGCSKGNLYAVRTRTGTRAWTRKLQGSLVATPHVEDRRLTCVTSRGWILALDPHSGLVMQEAQVADEVLSASVAPEGDIMVVGTGDGRFLALDLESFEPRWSKQISRPAHGFAAFDETSVYVGAADGTFRKLTRADGEETASFRARSVSHHPPLILGDRVYFAASGNEFVALDRNDFEIAWQARAEGDLVSAPYHAYGAVYVGSSDDRLHVFEP